MKITKHILHFFIISTLILCNLVTGAISQPTDDYIDITCEEAWEFLSSTDNGIQIPIDVRTIVEWEDKRIDTPYPEYARHFVKDDIIDPETYQTFLELYDYNDVIIYCKSGGRSATAASTLVSRGFNGTVYNVLGGITDWGAIGLPIKEGNDQPDQPNSPEGSNVCIISKEYTFTASGADINDDMIRIGWDWNGDFIADDWTELIQINTEIEMSHAWNIEGTYQVRVVTEDIVGSQSAFSEPLEIIVNNPPQKPTIEGPSSGAPNEEYTYTITSSDIDNDELYYHIEWGDGTLEEWIGPYQSDETLTITHTWDQKGTYEIKVKAKDTHGTESEISTLTVSMPKTKNQLQNILFELIEMIDHIISYFFPFISLT